MTRAVDPRTGRAGALKTFSDECGGRPPVQVWGTRGMASSMHPLASQAAVDVMRRGGNAVDAAIALAAVISVTSPDWAGPAGDSAWLVCDARSGSFHHLDGYSACASRTTPELIRQYFDLDPQRDARAFQEEPPERRHVGVVTAMVPGTPAAWVELVKRFGSLGLQELLDPAIQIAVSGFPVNRYLADALETHRSKLVPFESTRGMVGDGAGNMLGEGARLRQQDLAQTLRRLATHGHDGFYGGRTADLIVEHCARHGGVISHEDLKSYRAVWRDVIKGTYRGKEVVVTAPPTAGVHVLQTLNILDGFDLAALPYHGAASLHLLIEALKLALADRRAMGGDPDFFRMDVEKIAGRTYAGLLRARIDPDRALRGEPTEFTAGSTTHFAVVDAAGNMVNATQTIGARFGCGDVIAGTGMFMNDRTWWMALGGSPNTVAPGHRANIGHAPTMLADGGRPFAAMGSPGGFGIVQYVVQVIVNMLDYGLDIQSAIEAPRFKMESVDGRVGMEGRINAETKKALSAKGHEVFDFPHWTDRVGGVEGLFVDPVSGHMLGGYDPRRNSLAAGLN
jgi:gamma-glutamyltranspeptidase/glutathione hydrolase